MNKLKSYLDKMKDLNVLVIGETMIDEYFYGEQMSQFRVECLIEFREIYKSEYIGGAGLVANNTSSFVDNVDLLTLTYLDYDYITEKLNSNVNLIPIYSSNYPKPVKTRYVNYLDGRYYFKSTRINDDPISEEVEEEILNHLEIDKYDIVIVIDKGHGMMTDRIIERISDGKYISVNCQANSENVGYNRVDRYKNANLVTLNQREIRNLFQDKDNDVYELISKMKDMLTYDRFILTMGDMGCIITDNKTIIDINETYNKNAVDPIGAGDAIQVIATLLSYFDISLELTGKIANLAGALVCETYGTETGLEKEELLKRMVTELSGYST